MCFLKFGACPLTVEKQAEQSLFTHSLLRSENGAMSTILPKSIPPYGVSMVVKSPVITYGSLHFNTVWILLTIYVVKFTYGTQQVEY